MQNKQQKILISYTEIAYLFNTLGVKKPFVCCGKSFQGTEVFEYLKQFDIVVFDNIRPNPRFEDMLDAAKIFNEEKCDFIIGAGGGSPIDSAKMIRLMTTNDTSRCLNEPMTDNNIKSLYIPTTAGTGAEATKTSVFYINENEKTSISNLDFLPDYVVMMPELLETLPLYQRKATALDALCHSIESYWSVKATGESREYAKRGIVGFFENYKGYINNTKQGNKGMLWASYYGGKAINITGTTAAHAMCYNITMNCNTAHGHSVASGLSVIWKYMLDKELEPSGNRTREDIMKSFDEIGNYMGEKDARGGMLRFQMLLDELELPYPKTDVQNVSVFASKVDVTRLGNNPFRFTLEDVENIYAEIFSR